MPRGFYVVFRILIGLFFVVVGGEKILAPYQNFLYVIESYEVFPVVMQQPLAIGLPWLEFFAGLFLVLGLWLKPVLQFFLLLLAGFLVVVGQALWRGLDLSECGCFGGLMSIPLQGTFALDCGLFILCSLLLWRLQKTRTASLDQKFEPVV